MMILHRFLTVAALAISHFAGANAVNQDVSLYNQQQRNNMQSNKQNQQKWGIYHNDTTKMTNSPPTKAPGPTESPTESPAPSPSPSAYPTMSPTGTHSPTQKPTETPTESPAPSPAPSASPTEHPTTRPSNNPTDHPTATFMPSSTPTLSRSPSSSPSAGPTTSPSRTPSMSPTRMPSINPTAKPTSSPSKVPTSTPTATPSLVPTGSPTEEAFKTKAGNTAIILRDIDKEMSDSHLTHFEVTTLEFIQDTMPHTDGYELEILAVTLLSQTPIYPDSTENQEEIPTDHKNATHNVVVDKNHTNLNLNTPAVAPAGGNSRRLTSSYLKVTFKVVGVVTSGVAPRDFNFTKDIINVGFANHMDEYLYRLSKVDVYFAPLKAHTSITDPDDIAKKGQFVAAVVFSILAFFVAVFASVYAIRRHLEAKRRRRNRRMRLSNKFQPSETYSEEGSTDKDQSDEEDPAHLNTPLQVTISRDTVGLENVPITPRSIASPFKEDYRPEETSPLSPGTAKLSSWVPPATLTSTRDQRPTSIFAETGETFRKWLTPTFASPVENPFRPPRPSSSPDPIALKASTTTGKIKPLGQTPVSIPVSFFDKGGGEAASEASGTPMGSLAESAASSFFNRVGRSVFTGRKSSESFLQARDKFSPRDSFGTAQKKRNDAIFAPRTRSEPQQNLSPHVESDGVGMSRPRTFTQASEASEVSDIRLNEIRGARAEDVADRYQDYNEARVSIPPPSSTQSYTLGARALQQKLEESSLGSLRNTSQSYDVFAPSGPIGIVVDTSKNGPSVHSLKSTSPMLGLINPGDLIIALDDEDTRKMTAASLTRLMAKRSRQKERKITLLSIDGF